MVTGTSERSTLAIFPVRFYAALEARLGSRHNCYADVAGRSLATRSFTLVVASGGAPKLHSMNLALGASGKKVCMKHADRTAANNLAVAGGLSAITQ